MIFVIFVKGSAIYIQKMNLDLEIICCLYTIEMLHFLLQLSRQLSAVCK